jgi:hypothetical protein
METVMLSKQRDANYRAYVLDPDDHIVSRHEFQAESSGAALVTALQYVDGYDVEIWQRAHIVGRLKRKTRASEGSRPSAP